MGEVAADAREQRTGALVRHVADGGADVLVVLGSTGEAATITESERDPLITACLEEARGKKVVAGTGHNSTRQTVAWTKRAHGLHDAAMESLKAIDARDVNALMNAGETLDESCESCHRNYWYRVPPPAGESGSVRQ